MKLLIRSLLAAASLSLAACGANHDADAQAASAPAAPPANELDMAPPLTAGNIAPTGEADPTGPTAPHANEQELLQSGGYAAQFGMQLSQLALTKGLSADMKDFADRILADYTRDLTYLKPAADKAGVKLPASLDATHKAQISALTKLKGKEFATKYAAQVKSSSQLLANTLAAYRESMPTQTQELQTWISATLPIARNHLGMVMEVEQGKTEL
jgi:putative membrane protein